MPHQRRIPESLRHRRVAIFCSAQLWLRLAGMLCLLSSVLPAAAAPMADKVTGAQKEAALEFLAAVASGDPQQVALALHPDELLALRMRILTLLRDEAKNSDSTIRSRLF